MYLQRRMINNTKIPMGAFHSAHNEKAFMDRGSGFDYYPIDCRRASTRPVPREIKINLVAYLIISKHNIHVNIN